MSEGSSGINLAFAIAFAPKPFALISIVSSGYVILEILRHSDRRTRIFHRVVLMMNICNMVIASAFFLGTWAVPSGSFLSYGAMGNKHSCRFQGTLINFGYSVNIYYFSLSVIAFLSVKNKFHEEKYKYVEKYIHGIALLFPIVFSVIGLVKDYIHPVGPWCWIGSSPYGCGDDSFPCDVQVAPLYIWISFSWTISSFGGLTIMVFAIFIMSWRMDSVLRRQSHESRADPTVVDTRKRFMQSFQQQKMKLAAKQLGFYLLSAYLYIMPAIITRTIEWRTGEIVVPLILISICCNSLQGFFNAVVYVLVRNSSSKAVNYGNNKTEGGNIRTITIRRNDIRPNNYDDTQRRNNVNSRQDPTDLDSNLRNNTNTLNTDNERNNTEVTSSIENSDPTIETTDNLTGGSTMTADNNLNANDIEEDGPNNVSISSSTTSSTNVYEFSIFEGINPIQGINHLVEYGAIDVPVADCEQNQYDAGM